MALMETPICDFGRAAIDFALTDTNGKVWTLQDCRGERGILVMFICNHCPYVKAVIGRIVRDTRELLAHGVKSVAIMSNDTIEYPEDSLANMQRVAREYNFPFPYLFDETQDIARAYGAICTPDFFGYNAQLELQYRGRLDSSNRETAPPQSRRELFEAMTAIAVTGKGPATQIPSMGCSIKWRGAAE